MILSVTGLISFKIAHSGTESCLLFTCPNCSYHVSVLNKIWSSLNVKLNALIVARDCTSEFQCLRETRQLKKLVLLHTTVFHSEYLARGG